MLFPLFLLVQSAQAFWGLRETLGICTFTRADAVECMRRHVDVNHDGAISVKELRLAKKRFLPYSLQAAGWVASKFHIDTSIRSTVKNCRVESLPANGILSDDISFTPHDFYATTKTCLPTQWAMCQLKKVCDNAAQASE